MSSINHRIEISFIGDAPDDELKRAQILASPHVSEAIADLSKALEAVAFTHEVSAKTVRSVPKRPRAAIRAAAE